MTKLLAARTAQNVLEAEFTFLTTDTMLNTLGVERAFGVVTASTPTFDVINLPDNANVVGGELVVETVSNDSGTSTVSVGDSGSATRYLGATTIKTAARTALVPTGYRGAGENIRLTFANNTGDATAGKVTVRVLFTIQNRANETYPV